MYINLEIWGKLTLLIILLTLTAQKMKFSIKYFFSKYHKIGRKLRIWSHLLKKSLIEHFMFLYSDYDAQNCFQSTKIYKKSSEL